MPRFRADFDLACDLVLPDGEAPVTITTPMHTVTFRNETKDKDGFAPSMIAQVVADCPEIEQVEVHHRELLARTLDILAFSTHSRFKIVQCRRVVDWEPFTKTRRFRIGKDFDPRYPPDPEMHPDYGATVAVIAGAQPDQYVIEALRQFRLGLLDGQVQDQFQRFWLALEVIAEGRKGNVLQRIPCPVCSQGLECPQCGMSPLRRPMARQAIRNLLATLLGETKARAAYSDLIKIRDGLMHGRSRQSIEAQLTTTFDNMVNWLAGIAWNAIMSSMPPAVHNTPIAVGHRDGQFAAKTLRLTPTGTFECDPSLEHPPEDKILSMSIDLQTSFHPTAERKPAQ